MSALAEAFKVDLSNCDREPIHQSGAIQPHGVLFVLELPSLVIRQLSANTEIFFGVAHEALLGAPLATVLDEASVTMLRELTLEPERIVRANPVRVAAARGGARFDAIVRLVRDGLLVELESATLARDFGDFFQNVRRAVSALHDVANVAAFCQRAVQEVRKMTGFDRVMAYRFDRHDNGHVIAEDKRSELESYLDLHYPASDIPAQARRLYTINHLRIIVDVDYQPVAIVPSPPEPLDLSFSVLRSVSPIHCEYLRNMGIRASMSISLVIEGRLWGLIICHHYAPRFVPYDIRSACEFLSQALSWQVAVRERADVMENRVLVDSKLRSLMHAMSQSNDLFEAPRNDTASFIGLVDATGAAIIHGGTIACFGQTPSAERIAELVLWLQAKIDSGAFATEHLASAFPEDASCAGLLAIPLAKAGGSYVLWFRPEVNRTVSWAGDPNKVVSLKDGAARLSPRGSFALWKETVRAHCLPWQPWQIGVAIDFGHAVAGLVLARAAELERLNRELRRTSEELRLASLAKDDFLATVSHELRTPLNAMLGWLSLMRTNELEPSRFAHAVETVERNARAQAKLIEDLLDVSRIISGKMNLALESVNLTDIVDAAVHSVTPSAQARAIELHTVLDAMTAPLRGDNARLQQVVWNLLSNAVKFTPKGGRIDIRVTQEQGTIALTVKDSGEGITADFLPHVFERFRQAQTGSSRKHQGLGLGLAIVRHLVELHGGSASVFSEGKGLGSTFTIRLPQEPALIPFSEPIVGRADILAACAPELSGLRILLVDDEPDALEILTALLSRCHAVVLPVTSAHEALQAISKFRPQIIVSDIGMPGMDGYALIRAIRELSAADGGETPAVALTAYARSDDRARAFTAGFQAHTPKPVETTELFAVIVSLSARKQNSTR